MSDATNTPIVLVNCFALNEDERVACVTNLFVNDACEDALLYL